MVIETFPKESASWPTSPCFETLLVSFFAATGLLLAVVGLYGVISFLVGQRTREISLRMALGATRSDILQLVVRSGLRLILSGTLVGLIAALALSRFLSSLLFSIGPHDPFSFALVTLLLVFRRARRDADSSCVRGQSKPYGCIRLRLTTALERFMARDIIRTPNAPSPPPTYSQAVRAAGLVFVSGTGPHDPVTGKIVGDTIQEQTRQCLENVSAILEAAGTSLERVVSATVILLEETDFAGMNEEWVKWFPANPPARQGAKLPVRIPGMRVSIAAIAEA